MEINGSIQDLGSHCDNLIFDDVTKLSINNSIVINKFIVTSGVGNFIPYSIYYSDAFDNIFEAFINN
jgi:hypothetical protein